MTIELWFPALRNAADVWDDQADQLRGAHRNLTGAEPDLLGSRVAPHARAFLDTWATRARTLQGQAESHAAALRETAADLDGVDQERVEEMQRLMPWANRDTMPTGPTGPTGPAGPVP